LLRAIDLTAAFGGHGVECAAASLRELHGKTIWIRDLDDLDILGCFNYTRA
jgi:hypothetical protein